MNEKYPIIGIDLGTTNSCIGTFNTETKKIEIIPMTESSNLYPSIIDFPNEKIKVSNVKRFIGKSELTDQLQRESLFIEYEVLQSNQKLTLSVGKDKKKFYSPEELSSIVLKEMKKRAEKYLKKKIKDIIVTVPAHFNDAQRKLTVTACTIAEMNVIGIINEPTAAALAYTIIHENLYYNKKKILVFDLGGGTLDISVLETNGKEYFNVLNTIGDTSLGGEDFTNEILIWWIEKFATEYSLQDEDLNNILSNKVLVNSIKKKIEEAKKELSSKDFSIIEYSIENMVLKQKITNEDVSIICNDLLNKCRSLLKNLMDICECEKSEIEDVILVGGATRMIQIKNLMKSFFNKDPKCDINPDEAIAYGATVYSAIMNGYGKYINNISVNDVTPMAIGIKTKGGKIVSIIRKNTKIPCKESKIFKTVTNSQTTALLQIYQGDDEKEMHKLGECRLNDIIGNTSIQVTIYVDTSNVITLTAINLSSGKMIEFAQSALN